MSALITWKWTPIDESTNHRGPALYAVRLLSRGIVVPIPRFLSVDTEGLLTIGMTTNLENRRRQFIRGTTKGSGHSAGNLLNRLAKLTSFKRLVPELSFELAFRVADDKQNALALESESTNKYFECFGEAPPLTSVIPDRYAHLEQG